MPSNPTPNRDPIPARTEAEGSEAVTLRKALDRWARARLVVLTFGATDAGFKAAWHELGEAEWSLAAIAKATGADQ
jgi:hypothetical protein